MTSRKLDPDRPCACGSGRKHRACHGLPKSQRPSSYSASVPRSLHDPLMPAELRDAHLRGARGFSSSALSELAGALLRNVRLSGTDLGGANFRGADLTQAKLDGCDLWGADFREANLSGAILNQSQLSSADFRGATLKDTSIYNAVLNGANFEGVDMRGVDLAGSSLRHAKLTNADIRGALLANVDLTGAIIDNIVGEDIKLDGALLIDLDITPLTTCTVVHNGPSHVDHRTIARSLGAPTLKEFLQRTGMPEVFVEYMIDCAHSLLPGGVFRMLQSTFISYGGPDTNFAQKLNDALVKNGVATFFFAKDAIPGRKLHRLMREGVNQHDRVILVCSRASLDRPGVLNEITETLQREARDGGKDYLIPITLDDYVFDGWNPNDSGLAQSIKDRVVADFRGADAEPSKFSTGLLLLIAALKK